MPNFALDDDLRRDYTRGVVLAQKSADADFFRQFLTPAAETEERPEEAAAPGQAGAGAAPKPAGGQAAPVPRETPGEAPTGPQANDPFGADRGAMDRAMSPEIHARGVSNIGAILKDLAVGGMESAPQAIGGLLDAIDNTAAALESVIPLGGGDAQMGDLIAPADSTTGGFIRSTSQFLGGFVPAMRAAKGISLGSKALQGLEAGAIADMVVMDPHEQRLSTWLNQVPALAPIVTDYLADNDPAHESEWEGRLKNAIEGAALGMFAEGIFATLKYYKAQRAATAETRKQANSSAELGALAAKDIQRSVAQEEIVQPASPDAMAGLGDPLGPALTYEPTPFQMAAASNEQRAAERVAEAGERIDAKGGVDATIAAGQGEPRLFVNHARIIDQPQTVHDMIDQLATTDIDAINAVRGGETMSHAQMVELSRGEYQKLSDLIGRPPGPMTAPQTIAARKIVIASYRQVVDLSRLAQQAPTPANLVQAKNALQAHFAIQAEIYGARTEAARAVNSWKIDLGTDEQRAQQMSEMLANQGGAGDLMRTVNAIVTYANDPEALSSFARKIQDPTWRSAMFELWQSLLLTGTLTPIRNLSGNAFTAFWNIPENMLAAGISNVFQSGEVKLGEAAAMLYAIPHAAADGFRFAARLATDEKTAKAFDAFTKSDRQQAPQFVAKAFGVEPGTVLGMGIDLLGAAARGLGFAPLEFGDRFAKGFNFNIERARLTFRRSAEEGLTGPEQWDRMRQLENELPDDIFDEAVGTARVLTFTDPMGPTGQAFSRVLNKPIFGIEQLPSWRLLAPFYKAPTKIPIYVGRRTPISPFLGATKRDIEAGGPRAAQAWARIGLSTLTMATVAKWVADGLCTGYGPAEPDTRKGWLLENQPYSCKIGGRWYEYRQIEPLGMMLGIGADMAEIVGHLHPTEAEDAVTAPIVAFAQNFASKQWTRGVIGLAAAMDQRNPVGSPGNILQDIAGSFVPGFVRTLARVSDPIMRDTRADPPDADYPGDLPADVAEFLGETINRYRAQIPGLSNKLPALPDIWGEERDRSSGLGWVYDMTVPINSKQIIGDPVNEAIAKNGVPVSLPEPAIDGVSLSAEEYAEFVRLAGRPAKEALDNLVGQSGFDSLSDGPDGMKAEMIKSVIAANRDEARAQMRLMPSLRRRLQHKTNSDIDVLLGR